MKIFSEFFLFFAGKPLTFPQRYVIILVPRWGFIFLPRAREANNLPPLAEEVKIQEVPI